MKTFRCVTERQHEYLVYIETGLGEKIYEYNALFRDYEHLILITDKQVGKHYGSSAKRQLKTFGGEVLEIIVSENKSNNLIHAESIVDKMASAGVGRNSAIVALGGKTVSDMAGFCAAIYLGGVDYFQIPTTLYAQVDSGVGGKAQLDIPQGVGIVSLFYQPTAVFIDPAFLQTLSDEALTEGMAEVLKYACVSSSKLFVRLMGYEYQEDLLEDMEEIIAKCVQIKINVVEDDELEFDKSRILNFGKIVADVIYRYFDYGKVPYGDALTIGMYQITKMSIREGITEASALDNLRIVLDTYGLPYEMPVMDLKKIKAFIDEDKTFENNVKVVCVIPKIGKAEIVKLHRDQAIELFITEETFEEI